MKEGNRRMYIHLGGEKVIRSRELIAIFDIASEKPSKEPKSLLIHDDQVKIVERIGEEEPKSLVVTETKIYYSPISSSTLKKRSRQFSS
jgi:hypothetical protein